MKSIKADVNNNSNMMRRRRRRRKRRRYSGMAHVL
jgi:hypothetical protein